MDPPKIGETPQDSEEHLDCGGRQPGSRLRRGRAAHGNGPADGGHAHHATARRKTRVSDDGRLVDESIEDGSPDPGIGFDDSTPLGDSPELHDDIDPHDLPPGHPGHRVLDGDAPAGRDHDRRTT